MRKSRRKDLSGRIFGRLKVVSWSHTINRDRAFWLCKCDCGEEKVISANVLLMGKTISCGCYHREVARKTAKIRFSTHGKSKDLIYFVWISMKNRCYSTNVKDYPNYGGRGITVCPEWKNDFMAFYNWAVENGYNKGLILDRYPNNKTGNYEPSNCRWATPLSSARNTRKVKMNLVKARVARRLYNLFGFNTMEISKVFDVSYHTIYGLIKNGRWT